MSKINNPTISEQYFINDDVEMIKDGEWGGQFAIICLLYNSMKCFDQLVVIPNNISNYAAMLGNIDFINNYNFRHERDLIVAFKYSQIDFFEYYINNTEIDEFIIKNTYFYILRSSDFSKNEYISILLLHYKNIIMNISIINNRRKHIMKRFKCKLKKVLNRRYLFQ